MDLAFATGHGPTLLVRIDGEMPLVAPDDVLLFGYRDEDRWYTPGMLAVAADSMRGIALEEARQQDIDRVFARRLAQLLEAPLEGFWLHLDVDVLDDAAMSAVDARQPDGMTTEELARLLAAAVASGRCLGMQVCNYDPERDPGMACGRRLVELLGEGLAALRPEAAAAAGESAGAPAGEPIE
jgi:arginase